MNMIYKKTWKYILIKYNKFYFKIKALKDFSDVFRGDIGGRLEGYHNLSQSGNCWVYDCASIIRNAHVSENAKIKDNAIVTDYAIVSDNARVSGTTIVKDNTVICRDTIIDKDIIITGKNLKIQNNDDLQKILEIYSM